MVVKDLTKAEEQIMQSVWELGAGYTREIFEHMPEPKPKYNTVSTMIRILMEKEILSFEKKGKAFLYKPAFSKEDYSKFKLTQLKKGYFQNSAAAMFSFFARKEKLSETELDELQRELNKLRDGK